MLEVAFTGVVEGGELERCAGEMCHMCMGGKGGTGGKEGGLQRHLKAVLNKGC